MEGQKLFAEFFEEISRRYTGNVRVDQIMGRADDVRNDVKQASPKVLPSMSAFNPFRTSALADVALLFCLYGERTCP